MRGTAQRVLFAGVLTIVLSVVGLAPWATAGDSLGPVPASIQSRCASLSVSPHVVKSGDKVVGSAGAPTDQCGGPASSVSWTWNGGPGLRVVSGCAPSSRRCVYRAVAPTGSPGHRYAQVCLVGESPFGEWGSCDAYAVKGGGCPLPPGAAARAAADCDPAMNLGGPTSVLVGRSGTTPVVLQGTVFTSKKQIAGARISAGLGPALVVAGNRTPSAKLGTVPAISQRAAALPAKIRATVVGPGHTLAGMNHWAHSKTPWHGEAQPAPQFGGGSLVYSDYPEFLATSTKVTGGGAGGATVEGVLYAERGISTFAATPESPDFRVYFNHENRTAQPKQLCLVFTATGPGETITQKATGIAADNGDPVAAGEQAEAAYDASLRSGASGPPLELTTLFVRPTLTPVAAICPAGATMGKGTSNHPVVNGIVDFTAAGPASVQVAVVVVDSDDAPALIDAPLDYPFRDAAHPGGNPARTVATDSALVNPSEEKGHVSGTYPYDTLTMTLDTYDMDSGKAWGTLIAGTSSDKPISSGGVPEDANEYQPAEDTGKRDFGNYGMTYDITIPSTGTAGEVAQVLINPRGVGPTKAANGKKFTNGFAGIVDVPSGTAGASIRIPAKGQPGVGRSGNLTVKDYGIGIGRATEGTPFTFSFMPPGGGTLPVAIVLAPAYLKATGTLSFSDGQVTAEPRPLVVPLFPK